MAHERATSTPGGRPAGRIDQVGTAKARPDSPGPEEFATDQIAHELRTPLTVIRGLVEAVRRRGAALSPEVLDEMLGSIERNAALMTRLIEDLDEARDVGAGHVSVVSERTDVATLVRETVADLAFVTRAHPVTVRTPESMPSETDACRVRQVVTNLVSNAAKFSPPAEAIEIEVRELDGSAEIAIRDFGPGVPDERREELFGAFSRLGATAPGLGLGLYLSRGIAQSLGGELLYEPRDGGGSVFVLRLPLRSSAQLHA